VRRIAAFFALPWGDRILLLQAVATVTAVRLALPLVAIGRLRTWAGRMTPGTRPVDRIAWAVAAASRLFPGTTCLASALALQRRLSVEGHASELHIGVARQDEKFSAHAWLVCKGRILAGELDHHRFTRLVAWKAVDPPVQRPGHAAAGNSDPA
jgi:hypothetical protein